MVSPDTRTTSIAPTTPPSAHTGPDARHIPLDVHLKVLEHNYNALVTSLVEGKGVILLDREGHPEPGLKSFTDIVSNHLARNDLISYAKELRDGYAQIIGAGNHELSSRRHDLIETKTAYLADFKRGHATRDTEKEAQFIEEEGRLDILSNALGKLERDLKPFSHTFDELDKKFKAEEQALNSVLDHSEGVFGKLFKDAAEKIRVDAHQRLEAFKDQVDLLAGISTTEARDLEKKYQELLDGSNGTSGKIAIANKAQVGWGEVVEDWANGAKSSQEFSQAFAKIYHEQSKSVKEVTAGLVSTCGGSYSNRINDVLLMVRTHGAEKLLEDYRPEALDALERRIRALTDPLNPEALPLINQTKYKSSGLRNGGVRPDSKWDTPQDGIVARLKGGVSEGMSILIKACVPAAAAAGIGGSLATIASAFASTGAAGASAWATVPLVPFAGAAIAAAGIGAAVYGALAIRAHISDFRVRDRIYKEKEFWESQTQEDIHKLHIKQTKGSVPTPLREDLIERARRRMILNDMGVIDAAPKGPFLTVEPLNYKLVETSRGEGQVKVDKFTLSKTAELNRTLFRALELGSSAAFWGTAAGLAASLAVPVAGAVAVGVAGGVFAGYRKAQEHSVKESGGVSTSRVSQDYYIRLGVEAVYRMEREEKEIRELTQQHNEEIARMNLAIKNGVNVNSPTGKDYKTKADNFKAEIEQRVGLLDGKDSGVVQEISNILYWARNYNGGGARTNFKLALDLVGAAAQGGAIAAVGAFVANPAVVAAGAFFGLTKASEVLMQRKLQQ